MTRPNREDADRAARAVSERRPVRTSAPGLPYDPCTPACSWCSNQQSAATGYLLGQGNIWLGDACPNHVETVPARRHVSF